MEVATNRTGSIAISPPDQGGADQGENKTTLPAKKTVPTFLTVSNIDTQEPLQQIQSETQGILKEAIPDSDGLIEALEQFNAIPAEIFQLQQEVAEESRIISALLVELEARKILNRVKHTIALGNKEAIDQQIKATDGKIERIEELYRELLELSQKTNQDPREAEKEEIPKRNRVFQFFIDRWKRNKAKEHWEELKERAENQIPQQTVKKGNNEQLGELISDEIASLENEELIQIKTTIEAIKSSQAAMIEQSARIGAKMAIAAIKTTQKTIHTVGTHFGGERQRLLNDLSAVEGKLDQQFGASEITTKAQESLPQGEEMKKPTPEQVFLLKGTYYTGNGNISHKGRPSSSDEEFEITGYTLLNEDRSQIKVTTKNGTFVMNNTAQQKFFIQEIIDAFPEVEN